MHRPPLDVPRTPVDHLHVLAANLLRRDDGLDVRVVSPASEPPYLRAVRSLGEHSMAYGFAETIRCAHHAVAGDELWFFWSWGAPMHPVREPDRAAEAILRVLAAGIEA